MWWIVAGDRHLRTTRAPWAGGGVFEAVAQDMVGEKRPDPEGVIGAPPTAAPQGCSGPGMPRVSMMTPWHVAAGDIGGGSPGPALRSGSDQCGPGRRKRPGRGGAGALLLTRQPLRCRGGGNPAAGMRNCGHLTG